MYRRLGVDARDKRGHDAVMLRKTLYDAVGLIDLMKGKIEDPIAEKAFEYWSDVALTDKWLALPPKTLDGMVQAYRDAYAAMTRDPEFIDRGRKISVDFTPQWAADVEMIIHRLGKLPTAAIDYVQEGNANTLTVRGLDDPLLKVFLAG
jgi:hypothetical protein